MIGDGKRFTQYSETFRNLKGLTLDDLNTFRPQKLGNKVRLLAGIDEGKYAISAVSDDYQMELSSTQLIKVRKVSISQSKVATIFTLSDDELLSIFISFAIDLESVIDNDNDVSILEIYNRYLYWQKMFKADSEFVSETIIKGLINELILIKNYMIPKYGVEEAIKGWIGTEGVHKDFAFADGMWFEAKAINVGKPTVKISSIEQLDAEQPGMLVISEFEKTSPQNPEGIRLFELLNEIKSTIKIDNLQMEFIEKIFLLGITLDVFANEKHKANQFRYLVKNINFYRVNDDFPRLKREQLSSKIGLVSYEIIISEIEGLKAEFN